MKIDTSPNHTRESSPNNRLNFQKNYPKADEIYFRRLHFLLLMALSAFSIWVIVLEQYPQSISFDKAFLALVATWLCFLPSIQYLSNPKRRPIPFFPLVGLFYALSFSLPIFSAAQVKSYKFSLQEVSLNSLILLVLGLAGMNVGFFLSQNYWWKSISSIKLPTPKKSSTLLVLAWLFMSMYLSYNYIPFLQELPSVGYFVTPLGYFAFGLFYILWSQKKLNKFQLFLVLGVFLLELLFRLATGALAQVVFFLMFLGIVYFRQHKRLPMTIMLVATLFFVVFNPVKGEYRSLTWTDNIQSLSVIEKSKLFFWLTINYYTSPANTSTPDITSSTVNRAEQMSLLSNVINDTPDIVPYWNGQTYLPIFTSFIPRALWPGKPEIRTGNDFGRRYKYLGANDFTTSYNLPWIVEMYANFGDTGIILGMFFVGVMLAYFDKVFNNFEMNDIEFLYGCVILFNITNHLSNFALIMGNIFLLSLTIYISLKYTTMYLDR
jgi:hypothetical protein